VDHTAGIWPQAAGGIPFNACEFQSKGDAITDLFEDLAADGAWSDAQLKSANECIRAPFGCPVRVVRPRFAG